MTIFNDEQIKELNAPLSRDVVKARKQGGRQVSYIEGWWAIAEANRIFGFGAWTRETVDVKCVVSQAREIGEKKEPGWQASYIVRVRVTVGDAVREGCGAGHGIDRDSGQAHESAIKEAETDAMKRALMTFGNPFGLALYDKTQANVADETELSRQRFITECRAKIANTQDRIELLEWWGSPEQKQARRDFELNAVEVAELKAAVMLKTSPGIANGQA